MSRSSKQGRVNTPPNPHSPQHHPPKAPPPADCGLSADYRAALAQIDQRKQLAAAGDRAGKPPIPLARYEYEQLARAREMRGTEKAIGQLARDYAARQEQRTAFSTAVAGDVELARIAVGLKHSNPFRVWLVALQLVRETGQNRLLRADVEAELLRYGIRVSERNFRRWLGQGQGLYWNITDTHLYFAGYETLAKRLTTLALETNPDLVTTNRPGKLRYMHMDVAGSLAQFEANVYVAWLAARENPAIARATLAALFNRTPKILRQWEKLVSVEVITNEAQYHPQHLAAVPDHARLYRAGTGDGHSEDRWRARMVNSYHAPDIRQHPKRGQTRRVHRAVLKILEATEPAGHCEQVQALSACTGGLNPTGRRYFQSSKHAQRSVKHTGKIRPRYIALRPERGGIFLWDYAPDGQQRTVSHERVPFAAQCRFHPMPVYAKEALFA